MKYLEFNRACRRWAVLGATALALAAGFAVAGNPATAHAETPGLAAARPGGGTEAAPAFVDDARCAGCHEAEQAGWMTSHHAHAMEVPSEASVRGDFDDVTFEANGATYRFSRDGARWLVQTEGPDGESDTYEIAYTFGWEPLQQYLVELDKGRLQALTVSWDTERNRWFDLAEPDVQPGDPLHWTGRDFNWNFRCADCHSTNLVRNYDPETDSYATTWSDVTVGCQACHGPAGAHVAWAEKAVGADDAPAPVDLGFVKSMSDPEAMIDTCAQCHSRRRQITDHPVAGHAFLDHYAPELLSEGLYFPDGQIDDEVYVYGSFLQSRMYAEGVVCTDCHDPHSGTLYADGNAVCLACHSETPPDRFPGIRPLPYDSPAHHFHAAGEPGSFCVDCHMPARTYMAVDPRRDHSFRVPRPDLSAATGAPDACTGCHDDRDAAWAASTIADWYGPDRRREPHYGTALALGRSGAPGAGTTLAALATDGEAPAIVRATAIEALRNYVDRITAPALVEGLDDPDPIVRAASVAALASFPPDARVDLAAPLLTDPVRAVRIAAARVLAPVPEDLFLGDRRAAYRTSADEYVASELAAAERPEAHLNLGIYWTERGDPDKADAAYRTALRLAPDFIPALINLAELHRARGDTEAEAETLERAHAQAPDTPAVLHALGLLRVRQGRRDESLPLLAEALERAPGSARYAHVYAVALESTGKPNQAADVRRAALERNPYDLDLLYGLLQSRLNARDRDGALALTDRLLALRPDDGQLLRLKQQLDLR